MVFYSIQRDGSMGDDAKGKDVFMKLKKLASRRRTADLRPPLSSFPAGR